MPFSLMFCWFGGGEEVQLGLFDRISGLFAEVEESLWCCYSRISMGGDQQWNQLYCCWAVFLLEISFEDLSIGSCYTSVISTQKYIFSQGIWLWVTGIKLLSQFTLKLAL